MDYALQILYLESMEGRPQNMNEGTMPQVIIYTTSYCPYCFAAKSLLRSKNIEFQEVDVTHDRARREEMERLSARRTVPQIFIDGKSLGGFDDVKRLDGTGELDRLLGRSV
jgi:glutaredoxin 3